jgi:hypothetical protein
MKNEVLKWSMFQIHHHSFALKSDDVQGSNARHESFFFLLTFQHMCSCIVTDESVSLRILIIHSATCVCTLSFLIFIPTSCHSVWLEAEYIKEWVLLSHRHTIPYFQLDCFCSVLFDRMSKMNEEGSVLHDNYGSYSPSPPLPPVPCVLDRLSW